MLPCWQQQCLSMLVSLCTARLQELQQLIRRPHLCRSHSRAYTSPLRFQKYLYIRSIGAICSHATIAEQGKAEQVNANKAASNMSNHTMTTNPEI